YASTLDKTDGTVKYKGLGARGMTGIRVGYGIANAFSIGIFLRSESAAYAATQTSDSRPKGSANIYDDSDYYTYTYSGSTSTGVSQTITTKGIAIGLEPKLYVLNKDKINLYFALPVGFSSGKATSSYSNSPAAKVSGLNYGLNFGMNWYWAKFIGMSVDMGYAGVALKGKAVDNPAILGGGNITTTVKGGGFFFGIGLITKFGGGK
ncbi:MAG: hypothetical protein H7329_03110, partial [Opitutaceae bacterium]|nr:hypothetical protein [Cytophagales bacterium]